jgi:hypothetical protein
MGIFRRKSGIFTKNKRQTRRTTGMKIGFVKEKFSHETATSFPLTGRRDNSTSSIAGNVIQTLYSSKRKVIISCHQDIHQMTAGNDGARCDSTDGWIVSDIQSLHQQNGFPLSGVHSKSNCTDCHLAENNLRFSRIGNDCVNCHRDDYQQSSQPPHQQAGFSTSCLECHTTDPDWMPASYKQHDSEYFLYIQGHMPIPGHSAQSVTIIQLTSNNHVCQLSYQSGNRSGASGDNRVFV